MLEIKSKQKYTYYTYYTYVFTKKIYQIITNENLCIFS